MTLDNVPQALDRLTAVAARVALLGLVLLILGLPITDLLRLFVLISAVIAACFGCIRPGASRWLIALAITVSVLAADRLIPAPQIQEGHNVYIPVGASLKVFQDELPAEAQSIMKGRFDSAYLTHADGLPGSADWWQYPAFNKAGRLADHAYAPSADALWQQPKYSRIVDAIDFTSQEGARIGAINRLAYNFYQARTKLKKLKAAGFNTAARIDRRAMPYFVMVEVNPKLVGGEVCWCGDLLWGGAERSFSLDQRQDRTCRQLGENDVGTRIFALAITPGRPLEFSVYPPWQLRLCLWLKLALQLIGVAGVIGVLVAIRDFRHLLLPIGGALSTILTTIIVAPQFLFGFHTHEGGNDGLVFESFGRDISQALHDQKWAIALRGGEDVFYYMPGFRYLKAMEDFVFGDTNFGILVLTMFLPIFLYLLMSRMLPARWSIVLFIIFLFTPIFERFGFAYFIYIREMTKGFAETIGYGAFLGGLALVARYVPTSVGRQMAGKMPAMWIGLAFAASVAMRPNLALPAAVVLTPLGFWLLAGRRYTELAGLTLGFGFLLLLTLHNWYFGGVFVPLTSNAFAQADLHASPAVYWRALQEIIHLNFSGENSTQVADQIGQWNHWTDLYRVFAVFVVLWMACRPRTIGSLRVLAMVALTMQLMLLLFFPAGRYSYLAWLLVFLILMVTIREVWLPWLRKSYPETSARIAAFPVPRIGSWFPSLLQR